jgi:hypothetical protein
MTENLTKLFLGGFSPENPLSQISELRNLGGLKWKKIRISSWEAFNLNQTEPFCPQTYLSMKTTFTSCPLQRWFLFARFSHTFYTTKVLPGCTITVPLHYTTQATFYATNFRKYISCTSIHFSHIEKCATMLEDFTTTERRNARKCVNRTLWQETIQKSNEKPNAGSKLF